MKFIALAPAALGLLLIACTIYMMRLEYAFAKKDTVLTHAWLVSTKNTERTYQYRAGDQTFTFIMRFSSRNNEFPRTYRVRYLADDPKTHEVYWKPGTDTPTHTRFNWFKYILMMLISLALLHCAVCIFIC